MMRGRSLTLLSLIVFWAQVAPAASVKEKVESLLSEDLTKDASRAKVVEQLASLGPRGAWVMAEKLETKDLFKHMALSDALIKLGATASPALRACVDVPPDHRARAALATLAQIGNPGDLDFFLDHIQDSYWALRGQALRGIGRTGVISATVEPQLWWALEDPDDSVRRYAAGALGRVGTPQSIPLLLGRLSDESFFVRRTAARAISQLWQRNATREVDLAPVIALTESDVPSPTRLLATEVLGQCSEEKAIERLKQLASDPNWAIRAAAIEPLLKKEPRWVKAHISSHHETDPLVRGMLSATDLH